MTSFKLLKIIFGALLLVIVSELTILFLNLKSKPKYGTINEKHLENKPRISKTGQSLHPARIASLDEHQKFLDNIENTLPAIHPTALSHLEKLRKSEYARVYIIEETKRKVIEVEPKGACYESPRKGVPNPEEICFPFAIKVESKFLPQGYHWIYFSKKRIAKTNVFIKTKNGNVPSSIYQIQPGDIYLQIGKWDPSLPLDDSNPKDALDEHIVEQNIYIINRNI